MICYALKVSVTGLIKIQWLHLRDTCWLFIFCDVSSLQFSSWGNADLWRVPSVPECPNLLSQCALQTGGFMYLPQIVSNGFWGIRMLSLIMTLVQTKQYTGHEAPNRLPGWCPRLWVHIWKSIVCEILTTFSIYPCSKVFIWEGH